MAENDEKSTLLARLETCEADISTLSVLVKELSAKLKEADAKVQRICAMWGVK